MIFINNIEEYKKVNDYAILLDEYEEPKLIIKKFKTPIAVNLKELDVFIQKFLIKNELIEWIVENIDDLKDKPNILKILLEKLTNSSGVSDYCLYDGTHKCNIDGRRYLIEIIEDDNGCFLQVMNKRKKVIAKMSLFEKNVLTTVIRNNRKKNYFSILYPSTREKIEFNIEEIEKWRNEYEKQQNKQ